MAPLKYKVIKSQKQYNQYCNALEELVLKNSSNMEEEEEIELLTVLIERWDSEHTSFQDADPVELLHSLMKENKMKAKDLVEMLGVSKGLVSDILNYKKGLSKEVIRLLSQRFNVSQEAFNRSYELKNCGGTHLDSVVRTKAAKKLETA